MSFPEAGLEFVRTYNSGDLRRSTMGSNWRHNYASNLTISSYDPNPAVRVNMTDGNSYVYNYDGASDSWGNKYERIKGRLTELKGDGGITTGWAFALMDGTRETYDTLGRIVSKVTAQGSVLNFGYNGDGLLETVTGPKGHTLTFGYNSGGLLDTVTTPDNQIYTYVYANNLLTEVIYPDDTPDDTTDNPYREYLYEAPGFPSALTGIVDEDGVRFATWAYDDHGWASSSSHAGGVERYTFDYSHLADTSRPKVTVTNPFGKQATYSFVPREPVRNVTRVDGHASANCMAASRSATYYPDATLETATDWEGNVTRYSYNDRGLEASRVEGYGSSAARTITTQWHPQFNVPEVITEPGRETALSYYEGTTLLHTVTVTDPTTGEERITTYTYTDDNLVETIDGPRTDVNDTTTFAYYSGGRRNLRSITDGLGHVTWFTDYDDAGRPLTIIDPNSVATSYSYNARGRVQSRTVAGAATRYRYNNRGLIAEVQFADGASIHYDYDDAHRLIATKYAEGNRIEYCLDAAGNRTATRIKDPTGRLTASHQRVYDELSGPIQSISASGDTTSYGYDANGNLIARIDARGNSTVHSYDVHDRLVATLDSLGGVTGYGYDGADNLDTVTDANANTTGYTHNAFGEVIAEDSPDRGVTAYAYDEPGNLTAKTDARGITAAYSYDALNRLSLVDYPGTDEDVQYTYDSCANGIGRLCRVMDAAGTTDYAYDGRGNIVAQTRQQDGLLWTLSFEYDLADRLVSVTYPSGHILSYRYDTAGGIIGVDLQDEIGFHLVADGINRLPFGPSDAWTWGNGLTTERNFDADYRLVDLFDGPIDLTYGYDAAGNITLLDDLLDPASSQQFDYDALDRLIAAAGSYGALDFGYDLVGNRLSLDGGGDAVGYEYMLGSNRLERILAMSTETRAYDEAGNTLSLNGWQLTYGANSRLVRASAGNTDARYRYDADGQRVSKTVNGTTTHFVYGQSGQLLAELDSAGQTLREYFYLDGRPLAMLGAGTEGEAVDFSVDNDQAAFTGQWPSSTAVAGFLGTDYRVHSANDPSPNAVVIDNTDSGFSVTGQWPTSTSVSGYQGANYQVHAANGPAPGSLVIDNTDAAVSTTGNWNLSTSVGGYSGSNYATHAAGQGENAFTWPLDAVTPDSYRLYARWTSHPNRATDATYRVQHAGGTTPVTVNQQQNGGAWQLLGTFELDQTSQVSLSDQADGYVIADAVRVEPLDAAPNTATWALGITQAGDYRLYLRWTSHANRASNATYSVHHANGTSDISASQQQNGGTWQLLGTFKLDASSHVDLADQADGYVIADALKVEPLSAAPSTASWNLVVAPGSYEIFARWSSHPNRATNATYRVHHTVGTTPVTVSQQQNGGSWQSLGQFALDVDSSIDLTDQADGYVIADAIRVVGQAEASPGGLYFIHNDHLGTPQALTDTDGQVVWQARYHPFGEAELLVETVTMPLRLPGQYFDEETGLHYNYFRDYDPTTGRYIESDPIGLDGGINTYAYGDGNPVLNIDPKGLAYSPIAEHGITYEEAGIGGAGKSPNACGCMDRALGLETLVGVGLAAGGQPISPKPFTQPGASSGSSPISRGLSKALPQRLPFRVHAPTTARPGAKSNVVGRVLGRWAPFVGWGILAIDYSQYFKCISECADNECAER